MYNIFETDKFRRSLEQDFGGQRKKTIIKLRQYVYPQLTKSPGYGSNIKKLRDWSPSTWRYRIGAHRFFYEIDFRKQIVFMLLAEHRSKAYKKSK